MDSFEFSCPTKIVCGAGALRKLASELRARGVTQPLVITDGNLVKLGVVDAVFAPLAEAGIPFALFDQVPPDSSLDVVNEVAERYGSEGCDGWIAVGGGSVIDTAKGAAASVSVGEHDFAALQGSEILQNEFDPLVVVPTTAGTGSEVTLVAVVADARAQAKLSYTSYRLVPHVAFLDPTMTSSLPPRLTATTGMDALTHAIEAYTSVQKNPVSDAFALQAIRLIGANLVRACERPGDLDARSNLALGSLMAGAAFSNAMVGVVHAIGHALGGRCHVPHGQAMMLLLPYCVAHNRVAGLHRGSYGELLPALDPAAPLEGLSAEERDARFEAALFDMNRLFHERYGVPIRLSDVGVSREDLPAVARQARYDGSALYNREEITEAVAMEILEAAF